MVAASLQRDLDDLVPHAHVQLAAAVEDQQASDGLPLPGREQLDLLQQAAPRGLIERGQHFPDSTVICGKREERIWSQRRRRRRGFICTSEGEAAKEREGFSRGEKQQQQQNILDKQNRTKAGANSV